MDDFEQVRYSMTAEGRAEQIIRDLSYHIAEQNAGEWILPDTSLWLFREIRLQIENAEEMAENDAPTD